MRFPHLAPLVLLAAGAGAQTFVLPAPGPLEGNTNLPLSAGIGRYQQWHSAASVRASVTEPMRFERVSFFAGTGLSNISTTVDLAMYMGHGSVAGLFGTFDGNYTEPAVQVFPRTVVPLSAGAAGAVVMTLNFSQLFTWDTQRPLIYELRVYGNGQGNQLFSYVFRSTPQGGFGLSRVYQGGNANAASGQVHAGQGLFAQFTVRPGAVVAFGDGCPGATFTDPVASALQIPSPGITWTHQLSGASSQRLCALFLGDNRTSSPLGPLPFDLGPLTGAAGCYLLVNPIAPFWTMTVGSPGSAIATMPLSLPPTTSYVGLPVFSQWLVADPSAVNGVLSASGGLWSIVAPPGG